MTWTSHKVRRAFVDYFKKQNHAEISSSSLIPENDSTLLFANAGMNQFKNVFLGLEARDYKRAVTVQKCVRAGGKHNDLENVGFTARHHTFFEMLGNFSFGDYFKKEAIHFAWELLTKEIGIPKDKLYVTVHLSDDEAADIWHKQENVPRDRIFRFDSDNFWKMGDTGPCGPCSEIFFDHGEHAGKESDPFKGIQKGEDRFVEIWNLVFMQFFEKSPGKMDPLPRPSVDTGSGLERVTAALQGKLNNYDTDLFMPMIQAAAQWAKKAHLLESIDEINKKGIHATLQTTVKEEIAALRVLADHTRAASFLIADGVLPSNEGRGYVLRRILRRGIRFGRKLSKETSFLPELSKILIDNMQSVYPELQTRSEIVQNTLRDEEGRFIQTLDQGTEILEAELKKLKNTKVVSGDLVFKLYDTYGFPVDLTKLMAAEKGFEIDEKQFEEKMLSAKEKARASWKGAALSTNQAHLIEWTKKLSKSKTEFVGYEQLTGESAILALSDGSKEVSSLSGTGLIVLSKTPFYAEGGGQAGDQGKMKSKNANIQVLDVTQMNGVYLHHVQVEGSVTLQEVVSCQILNKERQNTAANHSATHLLHSALRKVLGASVTQAGQSVDFERIRFDFTHNKSVQVDELQKIEMMINDEISNSIDVKTDIMNPQDAIKKGAMALFGEKYGDQVRVLSMGSFSIELCGGTHVKNTSQIRAFKILSESGVSSGVRRIEAVAGDAAIKYLMNEAKSLQAARAEAGGPESLSQWITLKKEEVKSLEKEIRKSKTQAVSVDDFIKQASDIVVNGKKAKLLNFEVGEDDREVLMSLADQGKSKLGSGVVIVVGQGSETGHPIVVAVSKDLADNCKAGDLMKQISQTLGGKGGGRPDFAQGAVIKKAGLNDFLKKVFAH